MKGNIYLKLIEQWEFLKDIPLDAATKEIDPDVLNSLLREWQALHASSIQSEGICSKETEMPMIPVSSIDQMDPDLIINIALYSEKQIIQDPIDSAIGKTINPLEDIPRFLFYLRKGMDSLAILKPLLRENLIELIPYQCIESQFSSELKDQLYRDWFDNKALQYLESRTIYKLYKDNNVLAFQVGDLDTLPFERYAMMGGKIIEKTDESIVVPLISPSNLDEIDSKKINDWIDNMFHITSNRIASKINKELVMAELFSGSIATDEIISYEFIKKKCSISLSTENKLTSLHKIPILGDVNLEKFLDFRSNELPSFISFRQEWNEGRGLFNEDTSSQEWMENINNELTKCRKEIIKNKKKILDNIVEASVWAGLGVMAGIYTGDLLNPACLTNLVPFIRDVRNALGAYYEMRSSFNASSPFFLLNVLDNVNMCMRTDNPLDLPEKMPFDLEKIIPPSILEGMPLRKEEYPQGKCEFLTMQS
jgi:hypothetical protein